MFEKHVKTEIRFPATPDGAPGIVERAAPADGTEPSSRSIFERSKINHLAPKSVKNKFTPNVLQADRLM